MKQTVDTSVRSNRAEVRNPILALPGSHLLQKLPAESRAALRAVLIEIRNDCRVRAADCWARHKAPMACYWKAAGVYANHSAPVRLGVRNEDPIAAAIDALEPVGRTVADLKREAEAERYTGVRRMES